MEFDTLIRNNYYRLYKTLAPEGKLINISQIFDYVHKNHPIGHELAKGIKWFDNVGYIYELYFVCDLGTTIPICHLQSFIDNGLLANPILNALSLASFKKVTILMDFNYESNRLKINADYIIIRANQPIYDHQLIIDLAKPTIIISETINFITDLDKLAKIIWIGIEPKSRFPIPSYSLPFIDWPKINEILDDEIGQMFS